MDRYKLYPRHYYHSINLGGGLDKCLPVVPSVPLILCVRAHSNPYLRGVDPALLEGAVTGILCAHVPIFAPVTGEVSVHTGQTPAAGENVRSREEKRDKGTFILNFHCDFL